MKTTLFSEKFLPLFLLFFMVLSTNLFAQVGIGTVSPDVSSVFEVASTTKGMLTPRMTTAQKNAIATPANGLMVYDTDLKAFFHYDTAAVSWVRLSSDSTGRLKFKRIKSTDVLATVLAAEKTAGGGTKYLLDATTLYEINGTIMVDLPIELNSAYIAGLDSSDDKLIKTSGDLFIGATGGSIRELTITVVGGGKAFNMVGTGSIGAGTQTETFIFTNAIVGGCTNVGKIENFALVFLNVIQLAGNTTGIIYKDIGRLLISNVGWMGNNTGTYETFQGTFNLLGKIGGFSEVNGANIGVDVSSNPTITSDAVIETVVFTGVPTTGFFIKKYTIGSYTGYNFNNSWSVRCAGIPSEGDQFATGNLYDSNNTSSSRTTATNLNQNYKVATNATTSSNLYRVTGSSGGRLTYVGKKSRTFHINASVSFKESSAATDNTNYVFYLVKIGTDGTTVTPLPATETFIDTNSGFVQAFPITGTVQLSTNESIEVYLKRITNPSSPKISIDVYSLNMSMN